MDNYINFVGRRFLINCVQTQLQRMNLIKTVGCIEPLTQLKITISHVSYKFVKSLKIVKLQSNHDQGLMSS